MYETTGQWSVLAVVDGGTGCGTSQETVVFSPHLQSWSVAGHHRRHLWLKRDPPPPTPPTTDLWRWWYAIKRASVYIKLLLAGLSSRLFHINFGSESFGLSDQGCPRWRWQVFGKSWDRSVSGVTDRNRYGVKIILIFQYYIITTMFCFSLLIWCKSSETGMVWLGEAF